MNQASLLWDLGFYQSSVSNYQAFFDFLKTVSAINLERSFFEKQDKQNNTLTLKQSCIAKYPQFVDILFETNIISDLSSIFGSKPYLTNLKHYLSHGKLPQLQWHRDTYRCGDRIIGNSPPVVKVALYTSNLTQSSPVLQLIPRSHRLSFDSKYFDHLVSLFSRRTSILGPSGTYVIFNSSTLHRRQEAKHTSSYRSATIFAFTPFQHQVQPYLACPYNQSIVSYYLSRFQ